MEARRRRRERIVELLRKRDSAAIAASAVAAGPRQLMMLDSLTYTFAYDDLMRWRAIEAAGVTAAALDERYPEAPREFVRRQFWLMSDESGATAWYAAELAGEVLFSVPRLIEDQARPLLYFLDESPFERGAHYAVARISEAAPSFFLEDVPRLVRSLDDDDPYVRFYAAKALGQTGALSKYEGRVGGDGSLIAIYDRESGQVKSRSFGFAAGGVAEIKAQGIPGATRVSMNFSAEKDKELSQ